MGIHRSFHRTWHKRVLTPPLRPKHHSIKLPRPFGPEVLLGATVAFRRTVWPARACTHALGREDTTKVLAQAISARTMFEKATNWRTGCLFAEGKGMPHVQQARCLYAEGTRKPCNASLFFCRRGRAQAAQQKPERTGAAVLHGCRSTAVSRDSSPLFDPSVLEKKRVMIVRDPHGTLTHDLFSDP